MTGGPLTILQVTHQGGPAGSTQSIFNLSQYLNRRGHRVLLGCRGDVLLARLAREAGLPVVPLVFTPRRELTRALGTVLAREGVDVINSHATLDRRALTWLRWRGGRPVVAIVSRLKDQHVVLQALSRLQRGVVVACVGTEPDDRLQALARALPARHRVAFVPLGERALAFYHLATLAALPSRMEGLSQSLLEAMALGLPVVASDAGGNSDLVRSGETGLLVPPLDPAAWAEALE